MDRDPGSFFGKLLDWAIPGDQKARQRQRTVQTSAG
jgi:hypothetical protein